MNIKTLNNGFKFKSSDLTEIHNQIMEWRTELYDLHKAALAGLFARLAVEMVDRATLTPGTLAGKVPLGEAWSSVWGMRRDMKQKGYRNPMVDFEFSISILPHAGSVYGIVFTERHDWLDMWLGKDFVEDFAYWNSGDRPDEIDAYDWSERYAVWTAILESGGYRGPAMCGFHAECTHDNLIPTTEEVLEEVPPFDERVSGLARLRAMGDEVQRRTGGHDPDMTDDERKARGEEMFGMISEVDYWLRTDEGQRALGDEKSRVASVLKPVITKSDIISALPALQADPTITTGT